MQEIITEREIIERLVRIETKVDAQSGTKTAAFDALSKANENEIHLAQLKSQMKLLWGGVSAIGVAIVIDIIVNLSF